MKLTTKQLKQMVKEELGALNETIDPKLDKLLKSDDGAIVIQGIEIADLMGIEVVWSDLNHDTRTVMRIMDHPTIKESPEAMRIFATAPHHLSWVLAKVARSPVTPIDALQSLMKIDHKRVKASLALNDNLTPEMLDELSKYEHYKVRLHVALMEKTSTKTLDYLIGLGQMSPDDMSEQIEVEDIVMTAMEHHNSSNETLLSLATGHFHTGFRERAAEILKMRGIEIPFKQDKFSDDAGNDYEF